MQKTPLHTIAGAILGVAVSVALSAHASARDNEQKPDARHQTMKDVFRALRKACATDAALQGILIKDVEVAEGKLRVKGFVDREEQADLLAQASGRILADVKGWKENFPQGLLTKDMKVLPIRTKYLKALQEHFANNENPNAYKRAILRSTRLDGAYFSDEAGNNDRLVLSGACIFLGTPAVPLDISVAVPPPPGGAGPDVHLTIGDAAETYLADYLARHAVPDEAKKLILKVDIPTNSLFLLKGNDNPIILIQNRLVKERARDDMLCTARYDAEGILQVEGLVGKKEHLQEVDEILNKEPVTSRCFRSASVKATAPWSRDGVKIGDWPASRASLQEKLSQDKLVSLHRQTRLDRVYLTYDEENRGRLTLSFEGISLSLDLDKKGGGLASDLLEYCFSFAPNLKSYVQDNRFKIVFVKQPRDFLQKRIAADRTLDGTMLGPDAYFDGEGKLCLRGCWAGPDVRQHLAVFAETALDEEYKRNEQPLLKGRFAINDSDMAPSHTREMLKWLREYSEEKMEDVWLDRLYFDEVTNLRLKGFAPKVEEKVAQAKEELPAPASEYLNKMLTELQKKHPELKGFELALNRSGRTPARYIRERVLAPGISTPEIPNPEWDGLLIERGFYTVSGVYTVAGLVDNNSQIKKLDALLKEFASNEGAALFPASGDSKWMLSKLEVIPLKPMLTCLKRVMPSHEAFDHIMIERAYHDDKKQLVFICTVVGGKPKQAAVDLLNRLFSEAKPDWQRRSVHGIALNSIVIPKDPYTAELAYTAAFREIQAGIGDLTYLNLAGYPNAITTGCVKCDQGNGSPERMQGPTREQIRAAALRHFASATAYFDVALLHEPDDSTTWYLRALCYFAQQDSVLAKRDLWRTAKLEREKPSPTGNRNVRIEKVQGELRFGTTRLLESLYVGPSGSVPTLSLKDCP